MELEQFLAERVRISGQHRRFYHFTDRKNLDSIRTRGLLSTRELRRLAAGNQERASEGGIEADT